MIKVNFVCVGNLKEKFFVDAANEYLKRLSRYCRAEVKEIAERRTPEEEADDILRALRGTVIVLAVEGKKLSSEGFAARLKRIADAGGEITFVIGSSEGLSDRVKARADGLLSFSDMTFPHRLMRVMLLEQTYRAFSINAGAKYHK